MYQKCKKAKISEDNKKKLKLTKRPEKTKEAKKTRKPKKVKNSKIQKG